MIPKLFGFPLYKSYKKRLAKKSLTHKVRICLKGFVSLMEFNLEIW